MKIATSATVTVTTAFWAWLENMTFPTLQDLDQDLGIIQDQDHDLGIYHETDWLKEGF